MRLVKWHVINMGRAGVFRVVSIKSWRLNRRNGKESISVLMNATLKKVILSTVTQDQGCFIFKRHTINQSEVADNERVEELYTSYSQKLK